MDTTFDPALALNVAGRSGLAKTAWTPPRLKSSLALSKSCEKLSANTTGAFSAFVRLKLNKKIGSDIAARFNSQILLGFLIKTIDD
ncbi:MAG: hypothetical protein HY545_01935 [Candidatus Doudnabacteria bacterium]|nr:hypothetical protein [Candidatus Doudnabacteria bacterium]